MPTKQQLDKAAWEWAETVQLDKITMEHVETAYRVKLKPCKPNGCRRNCKGNPHCLNGLGEKGWMQDIADEEWHEIDDPNIERRQKGSFVGLKNLGATCYVNSYLQVWYHNPAFRAGIYMWKPEDDPQEREALEAAKNKSTPEDWVFEPTSCIGHLQLIFSLLQFSSRRYIDPTPFINCLGLNASQQQDAQEFCKLLISLLEERLLFQTDVAIRNIVQEQYSGEYAYVTKCQHCLSESACPSKFYELDLNIKGHKDLHECLEEFLQEEKLDGSNQYHCNHCQSKQNAIRTIRLIRLPPVLNLQLLRFVFDRQTGCKKKLNSFIRFPEVLDMSKYLQKPAGSVTYSLSAVLIHRGPSAYSGHYVAHIRDRQTGEWYKFNDENVEKIQGKLELEPEEKLIEENVSKTEGKAPRTAKGHHSSNNAYMLVYQLKNENNKGFPPDDSDEWNIPEHLQEVVAQDNSKFEEWIKELEIMREQNVAIGKARQSEIRNLYEMLPAKEGSPYEWISTEWLMKWLTSDTRQVPPVDNNHVLCIHGNLNPDNVTKMKCISTKAADEIFNKYGGGPRLRDALCMKCVEARCRLIQVKAHLQEDSKIFASLLRAKVADDEPGYWVGKESLRSWRKMVLQHYEAISPTSDSNCPEEPSESGDHATETPSSGEVIGDVDLLQNRLPDEEEYDTATQLSFNEDVMCEHGNLLLDEGSRRLVQPELWKRLKHYFPSAPEFPHTCKACPVCEAQAAENRQVRDQNRKTALEQKSVLQDLYLDRNRPCWHKIEPNITIYAIDREFLDNWRRFIRDPTRKSPVKSVFNSALLCSHAGLLYSPESATPHSSDDRLALLWEYEWQTIVQLFEVDTEICFRKEQVDSQIVLHTVPEVCDSCLMSRLLEEQQRLLEFTNAKIYVRRLSKLDDVSTGNESMISDAENLDSGTEPSVGVKEDDPEFTQNLKKKKATNGMEVVTVGDSQLRRSTRRRKMRGEKEFIISADQTLRDLKLQIMKVFSVAPYDQHLTLNGRPLTDNQAKLADLNIFPDSLILLKADEPSEEAILMEDFLKASTPETGFKGTGLLKS